MNKELLRKIGLTDGEIRVYEALVNLGKSSTGPIMKKSGISSSKVYLILEKLIKKGLVSFVIENNVKHFQPTNPKNILEYLDKQKQEIEQIKKDSSNMIIQLSKEIGKYEEESAQIYKGWRGIRPAFNNVLDELDKDNEYLFFSMSKQEYTDKAIKFIKSVGEKRIKKGIKSKGIADVKLKTFLTEKFSYRKDLKIKFHKLTLPSAMVIGKNRIIILLWIKEPIAFEIISSTITKRYREFFYKMWETI